MSEKRRALGRGLGALIPSGTATADRPVDVFFRDRDEPPRTRTAAARPAPRRHDVPAGQEPESGTEAAAVPAAVDPHALRPVPGAEFADLPVGSIRPNPKQPRTVFDEDDMAELVNSIREIGVLQPIVVRPMATPEGEVRFELIMGERRWRASREAGKDSVPAIIRSTDEDDLLRDALLENLHRSQLNALEEAAAYQQLLDDFGCTQEVLAQRIGRSRPQISNTLRLLKLPPVVARRVAAGVLSAGPRPRPARPCPTPARWSASPSGSSPRACRCAPSRSSSRSARADTPPARRAPRAGGRRPQLDDLAADLSDRLDTRVRIALGAKKGRLTVEFASVEDLNRILDAMQLRGARD